MPERKEKESAVGWCLALACLLCCLGGMKRKEIVKRNNALFLSSNVQSTCLKALVEKVLLAFTLFKIKISH